MPSTALPYEPPASTPALSPLGFDFRRGNHFMAPGWMTSKEIYTKVVREKWLDENGQYAFKSELHLRNGHWDRFFDSLTGSRDCIFPEIPRIIHQGADGFTVDQRAQMELYSNLKLSALPVETDYGRITSPHEGRLYPIPARIHCFCYAFSPPSKNHASSVTAISSSWFHRRRVIRMKHGTQC